MSVTLEEIVRRRWLEDAAAESLFRCYRASLPLDRAHYGWENLDESAKDVWRGTARRHLDYLVDGLLVAFSDYDLVPHEPSD